MEKTSINEKEVRIVVDRFLVPKFDIICITDALNAREKGLIGRGAGSVSYLETQWCVRVSLDHWRGSSLLHR